MKPAKIKNLMRQKGLTQESLADRFGVSQTAMHFLIHGQLRSKRLQRRFARVLGLKVEELSGEVQQ